MSRPSALFKRWRHYHEADEGDVSVYRPASADFPRSRSRRGFEFHPDGAFVYVDIARGDGTVEVPGRWERRDDGRIRVTLDDGRTYAMDIVAVSDEELRIRWG